MNCFIHAKNIYIVQYKWISLSISKTYSSIQPLFYKWVLFPGVFFLNNFLSFLFCLQSAKMLGGLSGELTLEIRPEFETQASKVIRLGAEKAKSQQENTVLSGDNDKLNAEVARLGGEVDKMSAENDRFSANNDKLEAENKRFEENNNRLETSCNKLEEENTKFEENNKKLEEQNNVFEASNKRLEDSCNKLEGENNKFAESNKKLEGEVNRLDVLFMFWKNI